MEEPPPVMCPSAQPGMKELQLIGVVTFDEGAPRIAYLNETVPVTNDLLASAAPAEPREWRHTAKNGVDSMP